MNYETKEAYLILTNDESLYQKYMNAKNWVECLYIFETRPNKADNVRAIDVNWNKIYELRSES